LFYFSEQTKLFFFFSSETQAKFNRKFIYFFFFLFQFKGTPAIRSRVARLVVLVAPDDPKIVKGNTSIDHMVTTEDREIELECISSGGKPAAEVRAQKK
jgi:hypothetical protein